MKTTIIFLAILCIATSVGTTMYFTSPRVIIEEVGIPEYIYLESEPVPPDTVYVVIHGDNTRTDSIYAKVVSTRMQTIEDSNSVAKPTNKLMYVSQKRFRMTHELTDVISNVVAYGSAPTDLIENSIQIVPNKEELARRIGVATDDAHKSGMKTGLLIGVGSTAAIIVATILIAR